MRIPLSRTLFLLPLLALVILHPRLRRHIDFLTEVVCLRRYHPALGDGHGKALWDGDNLVPVRTPPRMSTLAYPQAIDTLFRARPDSALATLLAERPAFDAPPPPLFARSIAGDVEALADGAGIVRARTSLAPRSCSLRSDNSASTLLNSSRASFRRLVWRFKVCMSIWSARCRGRTSATSSTSACSTPHT